MATQADFLADPWGFLKEHILLSLATGGTGRIREFKIVAKPRNVAYAVSGVFKTKSDVFELIPQPDGTAGTFQAWWCPYMQNETHHVVVGNGADFCFTTTINGCSIGLGHETATGDKLVVHSNEARAAGYGTVAGQAPAQEAQIRNLGGATIKGVFGPASYRVDSQNVGRFTGTVVGWRDPNANPRQWVFRTQTYEQVAVVPDKYKLKKLIKM
jgi:hypothetical protein